MNIEDGPTITIPLAEYLAFEDAIDAFLTYHFGAENDVDDIKCMLNYNNALEKAIRVKKMYQ
ncbi:hypothetical protein [Pseudomonas sp.]|uniref:hypothetical protein n=1 Tax=Pseudomonas sp. TaxID=306 RepID=UPI003FD87D6A